MSLLFHLITFALSWSFAICTPAISWDQIQAKQQFTLEQIAIQTTKSWSHQLRKPYLKYGSKPPAYIEKAIAHYEALDENRTTTVGAVSYYDDVEYLIKAQVGDLNVTLNLDTGSADL
jgi:hypothetical protein